MILISLIIAFIVLYWIGGQDWAHTLFRDLGCSLCLFAISVVVLGFHWSLLAIIPISWAGFTVGDHESLYWALHGFIVALGMIIYAIFSSQYVSLCLEVSVVTIGTYLVSRFLNKYGFDVFLRGLLYATIPLWFLIHF